MGKLFLGNFYETRPVRNALHYFYENVSKKDNSDVFYTETLDKIARLLKAVELPEEDAERLSVYLVGEAGYHQRRRNTSREMEFDRGMFLSTLSLLIEVLRSGPPWKE